MLDLEPLFIILLTLKAFRVNKLRFMNEIPEFSALLGDFCGAPHVFNYICR